MIVGQARDPDRLAGGGNVGNFQIARCEGDAMKCSIGARSVGRP
jgi:hypothetical protein